MPLSSFLDDRLVMQLSVQSSDHLSKHSRVPRGFFDSKCSLFLYSTIQCYNALSNAMLKLP